MTFFFKYTHLIRIAINYSSRNSLNQHFSYFYQVINISVKKKLNHDEN